MDRKNLREIALIAVVITLCVLLVAIIMGKVLQADYAQDVNEKVSELDTEFQDLRLALYLEDINKSVSCRYYKEKLKDVKEKITGMRPVLTKLEKDLKIDTEQYQKLKRRFMAIRLNHWLLSESVREKCGTEHISILYFYTTEEPCGACEQQGHLLSYLRKNYDSIKVTPIDMDENLILINVLKEVYNINVAPSLLIDKEKVMRGYTSKEKIFEYACQKYNNTKPYCS